MPAKTLRTIATTTNRTLGWVMVSDNDKRTLNSLKKTYGYHELDIADTAPPLQPTKLAIRDNYFFLILNYPVFDRKTRIITSVELDFFIENNRLVIMDTAGLPQLQQLYNRFQSGEFYEVEDVPQLLHIILDALIQDIYPILRHMGQDVEDIEDKMFKNFERSLIKELLRVKTNIVNVRKTIQGHKTVIRKLVAAAHGRYETVDKLQEYFDKLVDETKEIWDRLELQKETIDALHETNVSLLDYQTNEVMKTLTIISVVIFPLTLVATLFSMRTDGIPFLNNPYGFWIVILIMALVCVGFVTWFKKKNWM